MTPKQRVLKRWPNAHTTQYAGMEPWVVYAGHRGISLNVSDGTAQKAWAQAARHPTVRKVRRADGGNK